MCLHLPIRHTNTIRMKRMVSKGFKYVFDVSACWIVGECAFVFMCVYEKDTIDYVWICRLRRARSSVQLVEQWTENQLFYFLYVCLCRCVLIEIEEKEKRQYKGNDEKEEERDESKNIENSRSQSNMQTLIKSTDLFHEQIDTNCLVLFFFLFFCFLHWII